MPFKWLENPEHIKRILQKIIEFEELKSKKVSPELKKHWQQEDQKRRDYRLRK